MRTMNTRKEPRPRIPDTAAQRLLLERWKMFPVGTPCVLRKYGEETQTKISCSPTMFGGVAVVWLSGVHGAQRLDKLRPALARVQ
jgi:hypothetical protein